MNGTYITGILCASHSLTNVFNIITESTANVNKESKKITEN